MKRVIVHIDRLVLNGFRREDGDAIAAGLQQELGQVFADRGTAAQVSGAGDFPRLQVKGVQAGPGAHRTGINIAQGIGEEIRK